MQLHVEPADLNDQLATSETFARLAGGDALDMAMYGWSLLGTAITDARTAGATAVELEVDGAGDLHDEMADRNGLTLRRELLRLARSLPVREQWQLDVRPFRPGADDDQWLALNNRAFAWHPEQAHWTIDDLHARIDEPWFDAAGFLIHEIDGRMAGFCWTKVHDEERPRSGEIFVIGVDEAFRGRGIGRSLVLAGLDHLAGLDLTNAMLYTEADNEPAMKLYVDLGFEVVSSHRWYRRELTS